MGEKKIDVYVPVVYAVTLKTTAKDLAVIHTQMIRAPLEGEPEGAFAEMDQKLKEHAANHIVKLGGVLSLPGLYLHVTSVLQEKDPEGPTVAEVQADAQSEAGEKIAKMERDKQEQENKEDGKSAE